MILVQKTANGANLQEILLHANGSTTSNSLVTLPYVKSPLHHTIQMQNSCGETILLQHSAILTPLLTQQQQQQQHQQQQQQQQSVLASPVSPGKYCFTVNFIKCNVKLNILFVVEFIPVL